MQVIKPLQRNDKNIAEDFLGKWPTTMHMVLLSPLWQMCRVGYALHVCMGVLCLPLQPKWIGIT